MRIAAAFCLIPLAISGCTAVNRYTPPYDAPAARNSKDVNKPRAEVWKSAVPLLAKQFFVINNIDQSSGLINLSYSGNPEAYIDCGRIAVETPGRETEHFIGASPSQFYTVMQGLMTIQITRTMALEGRINLIFEETGPSTTRITANTRYTATRHLRAVNIGSGQSSQTTEVASFNSGQRGNFPPSRDGALQCQPTGKLERNVLDLIN